MDNQQLINIITSQVMNKLDTGSDTSVSCSCGANNWDGLGTISELVQNGVDRLGLSGEKLGSCPDPVLARLIDHTLLKADASEAEIIAHCKIASEQCFKSVCINPFWVKTAKKVLRGSSVKVCTVVGFPLGSTPRRVKELETRIAIDDGADEIDMVINIGALKSGDLKTVLEDMRAVVRASRSNTITKVILENCYLSAQEIKTGCEMAVKAGIKFVKTSTGFGSSGAKKEDLQIMRKVVGNKMGVKASGGIRDHQTAMEMLAAGASRLGVSASIAIVDCDVDKSKGY